MWANVAIQNNCFFFLFLLAVLVVSDQPQTPLTNVADRIQLLQSKMAEQRLGRGSDGSDQCHSGLANDWLDTSYMCPWSVSCHQNQRSDAEACEVVSDCADSSSFTSGFAGIKSGNLKVPVAWRRNEMRGNDFRANPANPTDRFGWISSSETQG